MPIGPPKMIITDQDPAMSKAIAEILPNTLHRFCMWHILSKFSEKLDAVKWKEHYQHFHSYIWNSASREEFDVQWAEVIESSGLNTNEWLKALYDIRSKWIPAYVNDTFSTGMSSSQRAESCHAFFKSYVSKKNTLTDFVVRFSRALKRQRHQELCLDHKDINEQPVMKTMFGVEKSLAELFTHTPCFTKFKRSSFRKLLLHQPLPDIYVLRRWTKVAKSLTVGGVDGQDNCDRKVGRSSFMAYAAQFF
ncbi:protein FAR-RED IMPAIRED RESPONSE 1-like [Tripterygium wilfordii]|uniref:protein FAR-RED IMPAIRED RESPONSE 1-like n=1 Tax=Tripterygium wilfordii TaxID=458696 RepID=UPI0018F802BE|nr:protein FAR-RED IMPAIRED RESPONSE 1-like [Tripterygium wilfordii]